ncbi:MAG: alpha/beta hydrolase [Acidobacteriota bacterium]
MPVHSIETRTHGRYLVDRPESPGSLPVVVGFHGYAETAETMLDVLARLRGRRPWLIVSVQALNRFYSRSNGVVANWMTRQDRELAIIDNLTYVAAVVAAVCHDHETSGRVAYVGFSQGVAMAYRAAAFAHEPTFSARSPIPPPSGLVVLAGDVPPDVSPVAGSLPPLLIGRGTTDHWYTEAKAEADLDSLGRRGIQPSLHVFEDGHVWHASFLARAGEFLDTVLGNGLSGAP